MIPPIAKVVYEARRALIVMQNATTDTARKPREVPAPFDELTSEQREPLFAEIQAYLQSGEPMQDALGTAIVDALK